MADAQHTQIADAIVTSLEAASFSATVAIARRTLPKITREQLATLRATVSAAGRQQGWISRATRSVDYQILVLIQQAVAVDASDGLPDEDEIDAVQTVVEEIEDHLADAGKMAGAELFNITEPGLLDPDDLIGLSAVTAARLFTYRKHR